MPYADRITRIPIMALTCHMGRLCPMEIEGIRRPPGYGIMVPHIVPNAVTRRATRRPRLQLRSQYPMPCIRAGCGWRCSGEPGPASRYGRARPAGVCVSTSRSTAGCICAHTTHMRMYMCMLHVCTCALQLPMCLRYRTMGPPGNLAPPPNLRDRTIPGPARPALRGRPAAACAMIHSGALYKYTIAPVVWPRALRNAALRTRSAGWHVE